MSGVYYLAILAALFTIGPVLILRVVERLDARRPRIVVVTPRRFDVAAARAELVEDELLIVAALGLVPMQRKAGGWS